MTISNNLLFAILSLDSYNRGYNAGIDDGVLTILTVSVKLATLRA